MSIRLRMFIIIGGVFFIIFITAQVVEMYIAKKYTILTRQKMIDDIKEMNNVKQEATQTFIRQILDYEQAETDTLLNRITQYSFLRERYAPTLHNYDINTWFACAMLIGTNKRIDLVQNTNKEKLTALITLNETYSRTARKIDYQGDIALFVIQKDGMQESWEGPYIGVPFHVDADMAHDEKQQTQNYLMYAIDTVMKMDFAQIEKKAEEMYPQMISIETEYGALFSMQNTVKQILQELKQAQTYFLDNRDLLKILTSNNKQAWLQKVLPIEVKNTNQTQKSLVFKEMEDRYQQIEMIWEYAAFIESGIFDFSPFNPQAPVGITHINIKDEYGDVLLKEDVFSPAPVDCVEKNCNSNNQGVDPGLIQTFYNANTNRLFFGNSVNLSTQTNGESSVRNGTLTVGIDASRILKSLALAAHRRAFFATNNQILKGYNENGVEIPEYSSMVPLDEMVNHKTGIITASDHAQYFFVTLQPFQNIDFYFFLLNPLDQEFALVKALDITAEAMLSKIRWQTRIIIVTSLLVILLIANFLSKRITAPILLLSHATSKVGEGKLDEISLPPIKKSRDEIEMLYQSFSAMVEGLKEKEKVKGVLNKVVSSKIAEEILKGTIHLGGEERVVTVLFADIRRFTELTEKMLPHEVIKMLNDCMTKISSVIDQYGGVIDKYVGDEVMALFGAPLSSEDSALNAVLCAVEITKVMDDWNTKREKQGLKPVKMGVGIHTGMVVAGNMGAENRLNYTVLGANVNLASRLCSVANEHQILISKETLSQPYVKDRIDCEKLNPIELKGFSNPIEVYQVQGKKTP